MNLEISLRKTRPRQSSPIRLAVLLIAICLGMGLGSPMLRGAQAQENASAIQARSSASPGVFPGVARIPLPKPTTASNAIAATQGSRDTQVQRSSTQGVFQTLSSLGVVLCLFVGFVFLLRRIVPQSSKKKLPPEVLEVIGTVEWSPKQQWMLMRFGRKLLLVSQQAGETRVVAEETDPMEIDRLIALCEKPHQNDTAFSSLSLQSIRNPQRKTTG
ncbi:MAG: flagellar biosynthetic protein FliO [Planctomycetota bacterium]|nr:flagellar biosynthetic protein FliO [Planctomycetota bacterium]